ncbi:replicative helicase loader/inhibitor [Vallitalea maricola]|uniref:Uncharacterized protein n=1 Tax=Vallitalea maricola TaxID=3074433 RepID=A0ACB5UH10_9FIRM|nr:hypothetical protein AN2V17_04110 [Vallitalea sp. AN17-2]
MDKPEFKKIIAGISAFYSTFKLTTKQLDAWYENVKDLDYRLVSIGLNKYIQTQSFPPTVADIRKMVCLNELQTADELVAIMYDAVNKFGMYRSGEGLEYIRKHSDTAYKIVKNYGYRNLCIHNPEYVKGHLIKFINENKANIIGDALLTTSLKTKIGAIKGNANQKYLTT